jgi:hypothetical protein
MTRWVSEHGRTGKGESMGDLQEAVSPMVETLRSSEPLEPADRNTIAFWLESIANGLERLDTLMSGIEAKVCTQGQIAELEQWVAQLKMDYELQQMGFDPGAPAPPEWLRDSGEAVP